MKRQPRNSALMDSYKRAMGDRCSWPGCYGAGQHVHHIVPLSRGGLDEPQNYIALCENDHMRRGLHSGHAQREIELATYKHMAELRRFGFVIENRATLREAARQESRRGIALLVAPTCLNASKHEPEGSDDHPGELPTARRPWREVAAADSRRREPARTDARPAVADGAGTATADRRPSPGDREGVRHADRRPVPTYGPPGFPAGLRLWDFANAVGGKLESAQISAIYFGHRKANESERRIIERGLGLPPGSLAASKERRAA